MDYKIPKRMIGSKYRKEMWKNSKPILKDLSKIMSVKSVYMLGSFTTSKNKPGISML